MVLNGNQRENPPFWRVLYHFGGSSTLRDTQTNLAPPQSGGKTGIGQITPPGYGLQVFVLSIYQGHPFGVSLLVPNIAKWETCEAQDSKAQTFARGVKKEMISGYEREANTWSSPLSTQTRWFACERGSQGFSQGSVNPIESPPNNPERLAGVLARIREPH